MAGIGWRHLHYGELLERRPGLDFLEVHSENFFARGGAAPAVLEQGRAHYPISLHGVRLSLGLAVAHAADLSPLPFTTEARDVPCANVGQVQDRLQRPILVENLSAYLTWNASDEEQAWSETSFLAELARDRFRAVPTLIAWDTAIPALDVLLDEVSRARRLHRGLGAGVCMSALATQQQALLDALFVRPAANAMKTIAAGAVNTGAIGLKGYKTNGHMLAERALQSAYPVLGDASAIEWALHRCATAPDADVQLHTLALLTTVDPADLQLKLTPGCAVLRRPCPAASVVGLTCIRPLPLQKSAPCCADRLHRTLLSEGTDSIPGCAWPRRVRRTFWRRSCWVVHWRTHSTALWCWNSAPGYPSPRKAV